MTTQVKAKHMTSVGFLGTRTDIDRKTCTRTVPMKVLCLGLGRTGTSSMRAALIQLGYFDCYHMFSTMEENPKDADMWIEAFRSKFEGKGKPFGREEWDQLLGHCMAVTDYPTSYFAEELLAAYPDAKVILTVRDNVDVWHKSVMDTLWLGRSEFGPPRTAFRAFIQALIPKPVGIRVPQCIYKYTYLNDHPKLGRQAYLEHNAHIRDISPKDKFLEFNVKEGWGPLCDFLEVPVPDSPFPRVNDTKQFHKYMAMAKREALLNLLSSVTTMMAFLVVLVATVWIVLGKRFYSGGIN